MFIWRIRLPRADSQLVGVRVATRRDSLLIKFIGRHVSEFPFLRCIGFHSRVKAINQPLVDW